MSAVVAGPIGEIRRASASGGESLTTSIANIALLPGTSRVYITPRNVSAAGVLVGLTLNPWLVVLKTPDALTSVEDLSEAAQDGSTSTTLLLSSLDTLANGDFLLIGSHIPFGGANLDVQAANGNASVLAVHYWNGAWTSISPTDNTTSGGATLAVDGTVTWTVPTDWQVVALEDIYHPSQATPYVNERLYWTRWSVSAALDSSTTLNSLLSLTRSSARSEWLSGQCLEFAVKRGLRGLGNVGALTTSGTANLIVNVAVPTADLAFQ